MKIQKIATIALTLTIGAHTSFTPVVAQSNSDWCKVGQDSKKDKCRDGSGSGGLHISFEPKRDNPKCDTPNSCKSGGTFFAQASTKTPPDTFRGDGRRKQVGKDSNCKPPKPGMCKPGEFCPPDCGSPDGAEQGTSSR